MRGKKKKKERKGIKEIELENEKRPRVRKGRSHVKCEMNEN